MNTGLILLPQSHFSSPLLPWLPSSSSQVPTAPPPRRWCCAVAGLRACHRRLRQSPPAHLRLSSGPARPRDAPPLLAGVAGLRVLEIVPGRLPALLPALLRPGLPDECLFEILRRVQGARARGASACVSRRWLALLGGIRVSEIKRAEAPAVPDLNQAFVGKDEDASMRPACPERSLEGEEATDVALTAVAVADVLRGHLESVVIRGSHPKRSVTDVGLSVVARGCPSLRSLALWDVPQVTDAGLAEIAVGCPSLERLDVTGCPLITDKGLTAVAQGCPDLKTLTIEACSGIANEGLKAIGRCCSKLQAVNIKNCARVGDQGVSGLVCSATATLA